MVAALNRQNYGVPVTSPIGFGITNLTTVSQQVIGANKVRRKLMFFNPNPAIMIWICPANLTATPGGGSIPIFSLTSRTIEGAAVGPSEPGESCNCAWNAIADSGSGNGLTILEFL